MTRRAALRDRANTMRRDSTPSPAPTRRSSMRDHVKLWIYRYNLNTALYMLEPWERALFNVIVLAVLAYIVYGWYQSALHPLLERLAASYI